MSATEDSGGWFPASTRRSPAWIPVAWLAFCTASTAPAQCGSELVARGHVPGVNHWVSAMTLWDPDGAGPQTPLVVLGGKFWTAGPLYTMQIATYDPVSGAWGTLGAGLEGFDGTAALAVLPNGDLVAGGDFTTSGGNPVNYLARWNGASWVPLGGGTNGPVSSLFVRSNGELVVGG